MGAGRDNQFYVYVYIDPRNYEEFYYGKGKNSRSQAHLSDDSDSEKVSRIKQIREEGLEPIIRVIASGLKEEEALMVETALIWKLGNNLTNIASGQYVSRFRPKDTFHKKLAGFDYEHGIYYVNVGEGDTRNWDDCRKYGFLAAGGKPIWRDAIRKLEVGDIVVAYLKGHGYVGVGRVKAKAVPYLDFRYEGRLLGDFPLVQPNVSHGNSTNLVTCEYLAKIDWIASVPREDAKWISNAKLFTTQLVRASLDSQPKTIDFIDDAFGLNLQQLADSPIY